MPPSLPGKWKLAFQDEFDGNELAPIWVKHQYWDTRATEGVGAEISEPSNVAVEAGVLRLLARKSDARDRPYTGALVQSGGIQGQELPSFSFLYGYAEASIRVPSGQGLWPAFWMMPQVTITSGANHDSDGEIDVLDNGTGDPAIAHCGVIVNRQKYLKKGAPLSPGFHSIAALWEKDQIIWYVDGQPWAKTKDPKLLPHTAMYPIFSLGVCDGKWGDKPNAATQFPAEMQVDYIRVWQRED